MDPAAGVVRFSSPFNRTHAQCFTTIVKSEFVRKTLVRLLAKEKGLTQEQLAERIAVPRQRLAPLRSGECPLTSKAAAAIARGIVSQKANAFAFGFETFASFGAGSIQ